MNIDYLSSDTVAYLEMTWVALRLRNIFPARLHRSQARLAHSKIGWLHRLNPISYDTPSIDHKFSCTSQLLLPNRAPRNATTTPKPSPSTSASSSVVIIIVSAPSSRRRHVVVVVAVIVVVVVVVAVVAAVAVAVAAAIAVAVAVIGRGCTIYVCVEVLGVTSGDDAIDDEVFIEVFNPLPQQLDRTRSPARQQKMNSSV